MIPIYLHDWWKYLMEKNSVTAKQRNASLYNIINHLRPKNTIVTKELIRNFQINFLEPALFER